MKARYELGWFLRRNINNLAMRLDYDLSEEKKAVILKHHIKVTDLERELKELRMSEYDMLNDLLK